MKTTVSMSTPSIDGGIQLDIECRFGCMLQTNPVGSETPESPLFQFSHYTRVRDPDTLRFISTSFEGNNEQSLECPIMKGHLLNSRCSADESSHEIFQVLLGGFLYSKELLGLGFHSGDFFLK